MAALRFQTALITTVLVGAAIVTASAVAGERRDSSVCGVTGSSAKGAVRLEASESGNSAAIQQAIDALAAKGGGTVELSSGQFQINRAILLKDNVALRGSGPATVLKASSRFLEKKGPYGGYPLISTNGAQNITIAELTADQSGDILNGNVKGRLTEYLIDVRHSQNALVEGVATRNPFTYAIAVVGSSDFCIRHNSTMVESSGKYDQLDGIHVTDSHSGVVERNHIDQRQGADGDDGLVAQTIGSAVYDVIYRNNDVRGGDHGAGMQLAVSGHEIYNITIENNRFWGSPSGVRTGYYDGEGQSVHDVTVTGNTFLDMDGASTDFHGNLENIQVVDNRACRSGKFMVGEGEGNRVTGNVSDCPL